MRQITKAQAGRFLLKRHGLLGASPFVGEGGVLKYVKQVGCVQFDPVDVCGRSHELAFFAHVKGYAPEQLDRLLYEKRALFDYWDKNMSILPAEDWPHFARTRRFYRDFGRSREAVDEVREEILAEVKSRGSASSQELSRQERVDWYWSPTTLARAALESLYHRGELVVHHKTRSIKSYALAEDCLPEALLNAPDPCPSDDEDWAWRVERRIGAVGLLWNRPSDAWLGLGNFHAPERKAAFARLESEGRILPCEVEGATLYLRAGEAALLDECAEPCRAAKHARFLPPLDCLLWDRRLIEFLFDFSYKWEVYTPVAQRKYAHYTLPVLYGERFAGRAELLRQNGALIANRFWPEDGFRRTAAFDRALAAEADRLRAFSGLDRLETRDAFIASCPARA